MPPIDIRADHLRIIQDVLRRHLPDGVKVWIFGSRASWMTKDSSDLDLALEADTSIPPHSLSALEVAFEESDLPFAVDIVDINRIGERFRRIVEQQRVRLPEWDRPSSTHRREHSRGGWLDGTLAEACSAIDYGLTAAASNQPSGLRFLRITDIVSGQIDWNTVPYVAVDEITAEKYRLHDNDLVLARTGASTGVSAYVKNPPDAVFASYLVRLRARPGFDGRFLAYYLKSDQFQQHIRGVLGDKSAQPNASASTMTAAPLRAPRDTTEQRAIAHVLGTLDDKIELNRRMNTTLEAMARALFRSWFVDFDPVLTKMEGRDTGLPKDIADLFPDRLVESELGEIPQEWQLKPLDSVADFQNGLALQKFRPAQSEARLPVVKISQLRAGEANSGEWASATIKPECIIDNGDVVFSWSGSLLVRIWCGGRAALNQHLFKVTSERYPKWFYLHSILSHFTEFQRIAEDKATTMGHIRRHHLTDALCVVPPDGVIARFSDILGGLLERQVFNEVECRTLVTLRDTLLPKLVSGEFRVTVQDREAGRTLGSAPEKRSGLDVA